MSAIQRHVEMEAIQTAPNEVLENDSSEDENEITVPKGKYPRLIDLLKTDVIEICDTDDEEVIDMEIKDNAKEVISILSDEDDEMEEAEDGADPSSAIQVD